MCLLSSAALAAGLTGVAAPASAARLETHARVLGHDVSYPQCGGSLPVTGSFTLVGVDGGRPYDANPCLAELMTWAMTRGKPAYYVNTANPGPRLSSYWPLGQTSPRACTKARPDSADCAFDYGWNAAKDALRRAKAAARAVGAPSVLKTTWWLDVETYNTWESLVYGESRMYLRNDTAVLKGMKALLKRRGVQRVGVYSTAHQWARITGGARLGRAPVWYAGVGTRREAARHCNPRHSFTGGPIRLAQFERYGFDANVRC
jgi:hypothetical protein